MKNIAASVRDRLATKARKSDQTFNEVLQYYGNERLLYRLSRSEYADKFILKGALLFIGWGVALRRPTRDIDFRGYEFNTIDHIEEVFRHICGITVEEDGLQFDPDSVKAERIMEDDQYEGIRVRFQGNLGRAIIHMQVDIGFSDAVVTNPEWIDYPTLLDMPSPRIRAYPLENMIAEKFEAMVSLGLGNSRLKDYYDLYVVSRIFEVDGPSLANAIAITFESRNTPIPDGLPAGLSGEYVDMWTNQWEVLTRRFGGIDVPAELSVVVERLRRFLLAPATGARGHSEFKFRWKNDSWRRVR